MTGPQIVLAIGFFISGLAIGMSTLALILSHGKEKPLPYWKSKKHKL